VAFLHDFGKSLDGRVYLAMELLEGETLAERIHRTESGDAPMGWKEAVEIAIDAARALEAVHGAGLVHRDLKPENLYMTREGVLKLLDFGVALAKSDTGADEKRQRGFAVFGTPEYMAPEQVSGEVVDGRCDVYALGCVLHELLTGTRVFSGESAVVVMGKQLREMPESVRDRAPERAIPRELDALVMRALQKTPEARFDSALSMRQALEAIAVMPIRKRGQRRRQMAAAAAVAIAAVCGVGVAYRTQVVQWAMHAAGSGAFARLTASVPAVAIAPEPEVQLRAALPAAPRSQSIPAANSDAVTQAVQVSSAAALASSAASTQDNPGAGVTGEPRENASMIQRASVHSGAARSGNMHGTSMHNASSHAGHAEPSVHTAVPDDHGTAPAAPAIAPPAASPAAEPMKSPVDALDPVGLPNLPVHAEPTERGSDTPRAKGTSADAAADPAHPHSASPTEAPSLAQLRTQARVALGAQDWKAAAAAASMWLAREGGVEPAVALAHALTALGRRDEARAVMVACCKRHPESEDAARMARQLGVAQSAESGHVKSKHAGPRAPH
jgi:eukaryotic-like serine/threonine-protein kinase